MNQYAINETNPLVDPAANLAWLQSNPETVELNDPRLARITRLRLLTEPGYPYYDISYCRGTLKDGTAVRVQVNEVSLSRRSPKRDLIELAKREGVYAKGLGLLDESNWSVLR